MSKHGGFPYRAHRCVHCSRLAVTYPGGIALCAFHASDPNSEYYQAKAVRLELEYKSKITGVEWQEFCRVNFNSGDKTPDDFTWKDIAEIIENALKQHTTVKE